MMYNTCDWTCSAQAQHPGAWYQRHLLHKPWVPGVSRGCMWRDIKRGGKLHKTLQPWPLWPVMAAPPQEDNTSASVSHSVFAAVPCTVFLLPILWVDHQSFRISEELFNLLYGTKDNRNFQLWWPSLLATDLHLPIRHRFLLHHRILWTFRPKFLSVLHKLCHGSNLILSVFVITWDDDMIGTANESVGWGGGGWAWASPPHFIHLSYHRNRPFLDSKVLCPLILVLNI